MGALWTQLLPPSPSFTEKNLPSLAGKVFIVTGGNAGIGLELVKILYSKGGTVYIASRSAAKIASAIDTVKSIETDSPGQVKSLLIDLSDLTTIPSCVSAFITQESRLDVLWNNAGIANVAPGSLSVQGYEAHIGTNCLGAFLFTKLLLPVLIQTASSSPRGSVRVVFASSSIIDMAAPPGGLSLNELVSGKHSTDKSRNYAASKVGNWFLASEFDRRLRKEGIICVTQNPGNLRTDSWNALPFVKILMTPFFYETKFGAYTELWCGLSEDIKCEDGGRYAVPWGRWHPSPKEDILKSLKTEEEDGTGIAAEFWQWCEEQTKEYANAVG